MSEPVAQDTAVHRATVDQLPEELQYQLLERIRERRMVAFQHYQEAVKAKQRAHADRISAAIVKQLQMLEKEIARLDVAMQKVENRINKIRAWRLSIEDEDTNIDEQSSDS